MSKSVNWKETVELLGIIAIVLSLAMVAYEIRQNTTMMRAQTRDSLTEKQMMFSEWVATNEYTAKVAAMANAGELQVGSPEQLSFIFLTQGIMREWENSYYQYEQGLFELDEFEPRKYRWRRIMDLAPMRAYWNDSREEFSPRFRAEIDRIVVEVEANQEAN